jgi:aminopeptidase N
MEHQTITAYGNHYQKTAEGIDWLLFHEFGHEWWANLVTAFDWRDFWIHEGFESYMDALYAESLHGPKAMRDHMTNARRGINNRKPVAPRESRSTVQMYFTPPDYTNGDNDIYSKGALVLHSLRYLIGDEAFFKALRRMAYPDPALEKIKDGRHVRFATTDDFLRIAEEVSGRDLDWFFEVYLRQPELPRLVTAPTATGVRLKWEAPGGLSFPMPVDVRVGDRTRRVDLSSGSAEVEASAAIDPDGWVLRAN